MNPLLQEIEQYETSKKDRVNPLIAELNKYEEEQKAERGGVTSFVQDAYKSMFPEWVRENTPIGALANTASGIPQAVVDTANMLPTIAEWRSPGTPSGSFGRIPDVPVPAPESTKYGRTAAEWATPLPGTKFSKVADTGIGLAAATGEIFGEGWELGSGITATLASLLKGKPPTDLERATEFMKSNLSDVTEETAQLNIQKALDEGEIGTLSELAKDRGLMQAENAATKSGNRLANDITDITTARKSQIVDEVGNVIPDQGDALALAAQRQAELMNRGTAKINTLEADKLQQIDEVPAPEMLSPEAFAKFEEAKKLQDEALQTVGTPNKPSVASKDLSDTYTAKQAEARAAEDGSAAAWDAFDNTDPITANQFKKSIVDWANANLSKTEAKMLKNKFSQTLDLVNDLDVVIEPKEIQAIISEIKRINNAAADVGGSYTSANKFLSGVQQSLEKQLELVDETGELYSAARKAYASEKGRFEPGRVGKARGKKEDKTLGQRLLDTDEGGAVVADEILASNDPDIFNKAQEYIKSVAKRDGIDGSFLKNYDELLDSFPELKGDLTAAKVAQDAVVDAEKALDVAGKADVETGKVLKAAVQKSKDDLAKEVVDKKAGLKKSVGELELSKLRKDPADYLDKALSAKTMKDKMPETLGKLVRQFGRIDGGAEALRTAVKDRFMDKINNPKGKKSSVDAQSVAEFHSMKRNLIDSGVMTKDEVIKMEELFARAEFSGLRNTVGPAKLNQAEEVLADIGSSAAAIAALQVLPAQNQLMLASTVKRIIKQRMGGSGADKNTLLALESIITNPQKFLDGIASQKISSNEKFAKYIDKFIRGTAKSVKEDEEE